MPGWERSVRPLYTRARSRGRDDPEAVHPESSLVSPWGLGNPSTPAKCRGASSSSSLWLCLAGLPGPPPSLGLWSWHLQLCRMGAPGLLLAPCPGQARRTRTWPLHSSMADKENVWALGRSWPCSRGAGIPGSGGRGRRGSSPPRPGRNKRT